MGQSSYNIEDLYSVFNKIDDYLRVENGGNVVRDNSLIHQYCPYNDTLKSGFCMNYLYKASSAVINLLDNLKKYNLEYDKLAEYAILWLRYKLNQKAPHYNTQLNEFYTKHIKDNNYYNKKINGDGSPTYKDIIDTKKDLLDIKEMTKFSYPFKILLSLYNENNKNSLNCDHLDDAIKFADEFEKLIQISNKIGISSYNKMLYRLSDDYNNLKNKCTNFPPLPKIKTPLTKLIPVLSIFSVIPVFFGIAYKYSLFGVDKLFQRQYLRKKLKKVKKKMKLNI
ncbi:PIR protein CIR protein [Plasmodium vinckei brucechwatti]|uniref:PIR protein CIR protein n=1 Tax=Plasmodium vinckei brucechwatti TaxID=119398 RepID=A0A6V7RU25_PLAVN|nr:PIR protein CIR protein [Plasmodium vinckei brucechwatti]